MKEHSVLAGHAPAKKPTKKGKRPHRMEIRELNDKTYHITHHHKSKPTLGSGGEDNEPEEFTSPDHEQLAQHVANTFGPEESNAS